MNETVKKQDKVAPLSRREKLKEFYLSIRGCTKCALAQTRTNFVFGSGNADSRILFVGEAPGKNEDLQGRPFVGQAGKLLDELLEAAGFSRNEVFIANVLKCRPPQNRDPLTSEIEMCKPYLLKQIEIMDPEIICTMGRYSTQLLLGSTDGISSLRGKIYKKNGRIILPINHPAAALYTRSRMQVLHEDFRRLKDTMLALLEGKDVSGIPAPVKPGNEIKRITNPGPETGIVSLQSKDSIKSFKKDEGNGQNQEISGNTGQGRQLGLF